MSAQQPPSEEELREALRQLRVEEVLVQTVVTLVNVSGRRLTAQDEEKDVEQARLGIEAVRALLPLCPQGEEMKPVRDALSQLQMIYVRETQGEDVSPKRPEPQQGQGEQPQADQQARQERERARSKIWTPPGT